MAGRSYKVPESHCPNCRKRCDMVGLLDASMGRPEPGDCTLCIGCGTLLIFGQDMMLRLPTEAELCAASDEEKLWVAKIQEAIKQMRATFN